MPEITDTSLTHRQGTLLLKCAQGIKHPYQQEMIELNFHESNPKLQIIFENKEFKRYNLLIFKYEIEGLVYETITDTSSFYNMSH